VTREWEEAVRRGAIETLERLWAHHTNIDAKDRHGQTGLMIAAREGHASVVTWLVERGAALDHTAKYGLSALMIAVVRGHTDLVRRLVDAGADTTLRGTGAPGFTNKTAIDLAIGRGDQEMTAILRSAAEKRAPIPTNPHFAIAESWDAARAMLTFRPLEPRFTAGADLAGLRVHIRDHKLREVLIADRTLEAHYGRFVLSQSRKGGAEARRLALVTPYGLAPHEAQIAGHTARVYDLGPEPPPDDIDGRSPAVVTWHDGEMFYLIASGELSTDVLVRIADSMYG
jgi:uncharacterized protein